MQGWNDQFSGDWPFDCAPNLRTFVRDVRRDLNAPKLPFAIGQVGFDGSNKPVLHEDGSPTPRTLIQAAQMEIGSDKKLAPIVAVGTATVWDPEAHAIYHGEGGWTADPERWRHFGKDRPYHDLGSPGFFSQAGSAFGAAMIELVD